jgi:hypothetical protein
MATYDLTKSSGNLFSADGLGWFKQKKWWSYDAEAGVTGGQSLTFRRTSWGRVHTALDGAHEVGRYDKRTVLREKGPLRWQGVDYEFEAASSWKATFVLTRYGEQLATFTMKTWREHIEIEVLDHQGPPPALLVFCAWITMAAIRDRNAAAAG